jgi:integrase/plasmid stabilization system protein ParE
LKKTARAKAFFARPLTLRLTVLYRPNSLVTPVTSLETFLARRSSVAAAAFVAARSAASAAVVRSPRVAASCGISACYAARSKGVRPLVDAPVPLRAGALSTELAVAIDQARVFAAAAKAKSTREAYASDLRCFGAYCAELGVADLPADPATVATYLATIAASKSVATIRRRMVSIAQAHKGTRLANPVADPTVQNVIAGIVRTKTSAQRRMDPLTSDRLREAALAIGPGLKGQRDRAILLLAFACASRQSEIAGLDVADLRFDRRGLVVTIRRSKTDQEGEGREIGVPLVPKRGLCAMAVREWLSAAGIVEGPVFRTFTLDRTLTANRIDPDDVARLVKRLTVAAGIESRFAGHSLRAGFLRRPPRPKAFRKPTARERAPIGRDPARLRAPRQRLRGCAALGYARLRQIHAHRSIAADREPSPNARPAARSVFRGALGRHPRGHRRGEPRRVARRRGGLRGIARRGAGDRRKLSGAIPSHSASAPRPHGDSPLIAADSGPERADSVIRRIRERCRLLEGAPAQGRVRDDAPIADEVRSVPVTPYVVFYRIAPGNVPQVLRVVDGRRDLGTAFFPD